MVRSISMEPWLIAQKLGEALSRREFLRNSALGLGGLTVGWPASATAQDGNLTLAGTVGYGTERAAAELAAAWLTGVRNVRDDIEISYDVAAPVDVDLHVQEALGRSALIPDDSDVEVIIKAGIITLTGHVRTWAEHDAVIDAAWMARGVIDVRDDLQITG